MTLHEIKLQNREFFKAHKEPKRCTTHSFSCPCREWNYNKKIQYLLNRLADNTKEVYDEVGFDSIINR